MVRAVVGLRIRVVVVVVVGAVVVGVVVVVVVVPNVDAVAAVLVAPLDLCLKVGPFSVLVTLNGVVRISAPVAKLPGVRVRNARVPVCAGVKVLVESL